MVCVLLAYTAVATSGEGLSDRWHRIVRAKYDEFARKLERGDPSFLKFVDPAFVYIDPDGRRTGAKEWSAGMRQACERNRDARVSFRITEIRKRQDRLMVSYVWRYRYKRGSQAVHLPRLTESISTDTWKITGADIRMVISKDFRLWNRPDRQENPEDY